MTLVVNLLVFSPSLLYYVRRHSTVKKASRVACMQQ